MSCCSGDTQTREMNVIVTFRPKLDKQFQLKVVLQGSGGVWQGQNASNFDFGDKIHCGNKPPLGLQEVSFKIRLNCTESSKLTITGTLDIKVGKTTNRFNLPSAIMDCYGEGPGCVVEWPYLFFGEYLGNATIVAKGVKPVE